MNEFLCENLKKVEDNIAAACQKAGRDRSEVTLIAVSKTKPVDMLQTVYDQNIREFGENKVQELTEKYEVMPKDMKWHMIGHLQRNKVKYIVDKVTLIHSVDSLRLAEPISREAEKEGVTVPILIEVNIAGEETNFGLSSKEEVISLTEQIAALPNLSVKGLLPVAPPAEDPEENRPFFREFRQLSVDITNKNIDNVSMEILSMGMTGDYEVAIEEGATMVRVGTGIFGARNYKKSNESH